MKKMKMMELYRPFIVVVKEVHNQSYRVNAKNADEARRIVEDGGGDIMEGYFEYSHTLESDLWNVSEERIKD